MISMSTEPVATRRDFVATALAASSLAVSLSAYSEPVRQKNQAEPAKIVEPAKQKEQLIAQASVPPKKNMPTATEDVASVCKTTDTWLREVTSGTPDAPKKVTALYAPDAVLWGTVSQQVRDTPEEILAYFNSFATKPNLEVSGYKPIIRVYDDIAVNSGYYTFSWDLNDMNERLTKKARYSFVYQRDPEDPYKWWIVDHHSSGLPNAPKDLKPAN
eukprot:CAMPEP_0171455688 /NCGR_PEP_ID=MMETSP0945-20130129/2486_1 /TAXON_ID=109269 /ORGANISM="Vaucheria litorea, Strain CCMP2940" /LENGTH=215 /DNA_ID=CAMNT_0011980985 /DNA_START=105 /DNA_END=752 /DNA_ORIENTATION=+